MIYSLLQESINPTCSFASNLVLIWQKKPKPFMQIPACVFVFSAATFVHTAGVCFPTSVLRDYLSTQEGLGSTTATTLLHLQTHSKVIQPFGADKSSSEMESVSKIWG